MGSTPRAQKSAQDSSSSDQSTVNSFSLSSRLDIPKQLCLSPSAVSYCNKTAVAVFWKEIIPPSFFPGPPFPVTSFLYYCTIAQDITDDTKAQEEHQVSLPRTRTIRTGKCWPWSGDSLVSWGGKWLGLCQSAVCQESKLSILSEILQRTQNIRVHV